MEKIKGVNFGGWFVLESWMKPNLFEGIDSKDETGFCLKHQHPEKLLIKHWETFITKDDFIHVKSLGLNSIRLPIPWWLEGNPPYFNSIFYIHQALSWADEVGLKVLLDLHTAPGCQNGFDNGGIEGVIDWHLDKKNIDLTIDRLLFIVKEFKHHSSFFGIELLNEPHYLTDLAIIQDFYQRAYHQLRKITDHLIVFHDAFRPKDYSWEIFFKQIEMKNVAFDLHLYHCFDEKLVNGSFLDHINVILFERIPLINAISQYVKVIIGEWSLGVRYASMKKDEHFNEELYTKILADLQLYAYQMGFGYYFWNYKIESDDRLHWDLKRLVSKSILPSTF
jgi:glucan 1,3-beta-glucosidase